MPLPSFLQRFRRDATSVSDAVPLSTSDVEAARVRARRRLIGMVVLVGAGVVGFPVLFETQPRPLSADVQIVQAPGAGDDVSVSPPVAAPAGRSAAGKVAVAGIIGTPAPAADPEPAPKQEAAVAAPEPKEVIEEAPAKAPKPVAKPVSKDAPKDKEHDKPKAKDAAKEAPKDKPKTPDKGKDPVKPGKDAGKDNTKSVDKAADKSDKGWSRYVVQFGAFSDVPTAHEARMKVERLGLKTYTQQVDTPAGKRIRVRMGPYADKAEADKAMATLRKAGLTGAVLTL
jgi:DedD protein